MEAFGLTISQMEAIKLLNSCVKYGTWTMNHETGLVDVSGDFDCSGRGLTDLKGIRFGKVNGTFNCSRNKLTSLEGAPQEVGYKFDCSRNNIESLVGGPKKVRREYDCTYNKIKKLEDLPEEIVIFDCSYNEIETLIGSPVTAHGFYCKGNKLKDLEGAPLRVYKGYTNESEEQVAIRSESFINYYANKGPIPGKVLKLVHFTMIRHKVSYSVAVGLVKSQIDKKVLKKMETGLSDEALKGASMLGRFMRG